MSDGAVVLAAGYFAVFGVGFAAKPELVERFALGWTAPAGRTEVRCYYGAVSVGLALFLGWALLEDQADLALTGVLILATSVLATRVVGTAVDGGWRHPYTRLAIPTEAAMVVGLGLAKAFG